MRCEAVIIENRFDVTDIIFRHEKFIPKTWRLRWIDDKSIKTIYDYNKLLTSREFWEKRKGDKVLIFQSDSMLLRNGIEDFLQYDYVGAPFKFQEHGGNGGLSLRSRDAMLWCIEQKEWNPLLGNEDVYFSNILKDSHFKLAPRIVCEKFSVESIYKLGTVGYHAIEKYLTKEQVNKIMNQYE